MADSATLPVPRALRAHAAPGGLSARSWTRTEPTRPAPAARALDVAVLIYDFRGSGAVRNALRIAGRAAQAGLKVELWVVRDRGHLRASAPTGVEVVDLAGRAASPLPRFLDSLANVGALARALAARRPAILFSAANHMHIFAILARMKARATTPVRLVGRASNAVLQASPKVLAGPFGGLAVWAAKTAQRLQFAAMDSIVAVAADLGADLVSALQIDHRRVSIIQNGIDIGRVAGPALAPLDDPWFAPGAPPVVLGAGRLSYQKDFPLLLKAFAKARRERPMRLIILGHGSAQQTRALHSLAGRLGVADDVRLEGFRANPFAYMARAAVFVLSSRWEGASNVLLEAMACGCPVVATACPTGVADLLADGRWGPLSPVGDVDGLAGGILRRLDQPREAEALRARAAEFDLDAAMDRYVEVFRQELAIARRGAESEDVAAQGDPHGARALRRRLADQAQGEGVAIGEGVAAAVHDVVDEGGRPPAFADQLSG